MSRAAWTGLLIVALLAGAPGASSAHRAVPHHPSAPAASPAVPITSGPSLEVTGVLQYRIDGPTPYEVNGYLVLGLEEERIRPLLGRQVVVRGSLVDTPSIYMRRAILAREIRPDDRVGTPAEPPHRLRFGRVERDCEHFYLVEQETGPRPFLLSMDLSHLIGQPVAVAAEEEISSTGERRYLVYRVFPLAEDLDPYLGTDFYRPEATIRVTLAGQPVPMDQAPVMANDRVLVGLRAVAEALGARVTWNEAMRQVVVQRGNRQVVLRIGSPQVQSWQAGQEPSHFTADMAPVLVGGRTMVPIRVLADGLGLKVNWDPVTWSVHMW